MEEQTPGNYADSIHRFDYRAVYESDPLPSGGSPLITADSLVDVAMREATPLDGQWHFAIDPYDTCLRARWFEERYIDDDGRELPVDFSFDEWETITVPSCWNTERVDWQWYEGPAVYVRDFDAAADGERWFLHFEGANYATYVFLNGTYLGWHRGGSTPFSIEVTTSLGASNRLVVVVDSSRRAEGVPSDNTDWFNYGGLHRSVWLLRVPATFIQTASVALRPDRTYGTIDIGLTMNGPAPGGHATIDIAELGVSAEIPVAHGMARASLAVAPELWSPANPRLYDVTLTYGSDVWRDRVGFREIAVAGTEVLLNGQPVFLAGVCQHEESVSYGRSLTDADIRENFALAKEMGANFIRLAHYPHSARTARIADEVGVLLWEELPVYWAIEFDNPETAADAANQLSELIRRDRNRASVIIWSIGNENADTNARLTFMTALARTARGLDPTRLVSAACMVDHEALAIADRLTEAVDVIGINEYYGWYDPDFGKLSGLFSNSRPTKPVIITEFGADAVAELRGRETEMFTEDNQDAIYRRQLEVLGRVDYVKGLCPWLLYDFRSPRRTHAKQGYYNRKGLLDATRTHRKLAFYTMKAFYGVRSR
jgi:beta-glucuronidase